MTHRNGHIVHNDNICVSIDVFNWNNVFYILNIEFKMLVLQTTYAFISSFNIFRIACFPLLRIEN